MGEDRAAKAAFDQERQSSKVIDVGVADDDRIERFDIERKIIGIACFVFASALMQAAVEQNPLLAEFQQVRGTRDFASGAVDGDAHEVLRGLRSGIIAWVAAWSRRDVRHCGISIWPPSLAGFRLL